MMSTMKILRIRVVTQFDLGKFDLLSQRVKIKNKVENAYFAY